MLLYIIAIHNVESGSVPIRSAVAQLIFLPQQTTLRAQNERYLEAYVFA